MSQKPKDVDRPPRQGGGKRARLRELEKQLAELTIENQKTTHLNRVLRAIRRVNHIITRERSPLPLLEKTCQALVTTRGYHDAWAILVDAAGHMTLHADSGLGKAFASVAEAMAEGHFPPCIDRLRGGEEWVSIQDSSRDCPHCPLKNSREGIGVLALPLANDHASYGFLVVSLPTEHTTDLEEKRLLRHVASDLAYALGNIETRQARRHHEVALRHSEERFRTIFSTSMDAIFLLDETGYIITANPAAYTMFGYDEGEIIGQPIRTLVHPQSRANLQSLLHELHDQGHISTESLNLRADGTAFHVEVRSTRLLLQGKTHLLSIVRDITARKRSSERLEKLNTLKESLLASSPVDHKMTRITDAVVDIFDAAFARIWLTAPGDLCDTGCPHAEVDQGPHVCHDRTKCLHLVASSGIYTRTGGAQHSRVPFGAYKIGRIASAEDPGFLTNDVTHDPRVHDHRWAQELGLVSFAGYRLLSHEGRPIGVLALFADHSLSPDDERTLRSIAGTASEAILAAQSNDQIHHLQSYLHNIIDSMPSILVGVDTEGMVTQWNSHAQKATAIHGDDAIGHPLVEVFPHLAETLPHVHETIQTRKIHRDPRHVRKKDGTLRYEDITIYPLIANGIDGAVIRVDDVTDQVRIEEMMVQSERMLSIGGLAAGMAHEINNPLGGMIQTASVMAGRLTDLAMAANMKAATDAGTTMEAISSYMNARGIPRMLARIQEGGARAAEIVSNMLSFARKSPSTLSSHDIAALLDRTVELAGSDYDLKKSYDFRTIEILREYDDDLPPIPCEASKIQQVFLNILRNGAEAMYLQDRPDKPPRFILRLVHEKNDKRLRIEIEDSGPGMDEATRQRVFEPFFTTKPPNQGTGLGLSVSYFIITENHGGLMNVETTQGIGTKFIIHLPLQRGSQ